MITGWRLLLLALATSGVAVLCYLQTTSGEGSDVSTRSDTPTVEHKHEDSGLVAVSESLTDPAVAEPLVEVDSGGGGDRMEATAASASAIETMLWEREAGGLGPASIDVLRRSLEHDLAVASMPIFDHLMAAGQYQVVGHGRKFKPKSDGWDGREVARVTIPPTDDGEIRKIVLPEADFPELYSMRRHANRLREKARVLREAEEERARQLLNQGSSRER